jgi:hypothetical protein
MKQTLLKLTQDVLSSIDGDEINSINDTIESKQVVALIKRCYANIVESGDYPVQYTLFQLTASGDATKPTLMTLPTDDVKNVQWVRYDNATLGDTDKVFQPVEFLPLEEFVTRMQALRPSEDTSLVTFNETIAGAAIQFIAMSDKAPSFYTTFDQSTLIFDSYDATVDTTLQSSKTLAYGEAVLPWTESDTYVIPINDHQLLLNETIAWAWAELKQSVNTKAEREVRGQKVTLQRKKDVVDGSSNFHVKTPNYGRK